MTGQTRGIHYQYLLKIFLLILLLGFINLKNIRGQEILKTKYVSLGANSVSLAQLLLQIKNQTGINFCYKHDSISNISITTSKIKRIRVDSLLNMFRPELNYKLINGQIVIYKQKKGIELINLSLAKKISQQVKKNEPSNILDANNNLKIERKTITLFDTIVKTIVDTVYFTLYDTIRVLVKDTVLEAVNSNSMNIIHDTVKVVLKDTVFQYVYKPSKKSNHKYKIKYALEFYTSPLLGIKNSFSAGNNIYKQKVDSINISQNKYWGISSGFAINIDVDNWSFKPGLGFAFFNNGFNYFKTDSTIIPRQYYDKFQNFKWEHTDSIGVIRNSIISYIITDSILRSYTDSTLVATNDTSSSIYRSNTSNKFYYLEIPIKIGYKFELNKQIELLVSGGITTFILTGMRGKTYSEQHGVSDLKIEEFNRFVFFFSGSVGINYKMNSKFNLYTNIGYLTNLTNTYKTKIQINNKQSYLGLNVGLKYIL